MVAKGKATGRESDSLPITTLQMARAELLSLDPHGALFAEIRDHPGTLEENAVRRHPDRASRVTLAVDELIQAEMVRAAPVWRTSRNWFVGNPDNLPRDQKIVSKTRMLYGADEGAKYLFNRDGTAVIGFRHRHDGALNQDHREKRPHRNHTGQLDDVMTSLMLQGFVLRSGHRDRIQYRRLSQLAPDLVMTAKIALGTFVVAQVDSLLEGGVRLDVGQVLGRHLCDAAGGNKRLIILECRTERSAGIAKEEANRLIREQGAPVPVLVVADPVQSLADATQRLVKAIPGHFATMDFLVEYERAARVPSRIREKLRKNAEYSAQGYRFPVAFITETDRAERFVLEETEALMTEYEVDLMVVTSTYGKVTRGLAAGDSRTWTHCGNPVVLLPAPPF